MSRKKAAAVEEKNFEAALKGLEEIVEELQKGDLPLDRMLELFEKGVKLSRECQKRLDEAERKVELVLKGANGETTTKPFEEEGE
jgi:exodeoxyribonuclease VII small subunit